MKRFWLLLCIFPGLMLAADQLAAEPPAIDVVATRPKAEAGDAKAQMEMGAAYFYGRGVKKDLEEATKWYRMASDQNDPGGQCSYAVLLMNTGVKKNVRLAVELYKKSAEKGYPRALFELGTLYYTGRGVEQYPFAGAEWYEKAAFAGHVLAQYNIGILLGSEDGPAKRNVVDALAWLLIASEAGNKQAMEARDKLLKEMKPGAVTAAQARMLELKAEIERIKRLREQPAK